MGKKLISQRRGKGSQRYKSPSHKFRGDVKHPGKDQKAEVIDIIHDPARHPPLAIVKFDNGEEGRMIAPEGVYVGQKVEFGPESEIDLGNTTQLNNIPEGVPIYNIELRPNDGGKISRTAGSYAFVVSQTPKGVIVRLPSGKTKTFNKNCRATIGVPAGMGMQEKPFVKAGSAWKAHRARGKLYPKTSAVAMNSVDHPFGGSKLGQSKSMSRHRPAGRKAGSISSKRTGKKK